MGVMNRLAVNRMLGITGMDETIRAFMRLPVALNNSVERKCIKPATKLAADAIKSSMSPGKGVDEGLTRQSVGVRVRAYRQSGAVVGFAGYRRGERWRGKRPTNIAWLLEHGHRIVVGGTTTRTDEKKAQRSRRGKEFTGKGRVVGRTRAFAFVERAYNQTYSAMESAIASGFVGAVDEAVREVSRG